MQSFSSRSQLSYLCPKCGSRGVEYSCFFDLRLHMERDHGLGCLGKEGRKHPSSLSESQVYGWAGKLVRQSLKNQQRQLACESESGRIRQVPSVWEHQLQLGDAEKQLELQTMLVEKERQLDRIKKANDHMLMEDFMRRLEGSLSSSLYKAVTTQDRVMGKMVEHRNRELEKMRTESQVLQMDRSHLLSEVYHLYEDLQLTRDRLDQQSVVLAEREGQVSRTTSELQQIYTFLLRCTQREAKGRSELERFFNELISRATTAEAEARSLRKQLPLHQQNAGKPRQTAHAFDRQGTS